jgi:undecaprenyl diphosphate synthase
MHVAFIMDGNRRWAKQNMFERIMGHRSGVETIDRILAVAPKYNINTITIYALSTENLTQRSSDEVGDIFKVMVEAARKYKRKLIGNNVRAKVMGNLKSLPSKFAEIVSGLEEDTKDCTGQLLQICIGYGGKDEIVRAVQKIVEKGEAVTEDSISRNLDSSLEPDLIIRTGGDFRLSNFLLWQSSYTQLHFSKTLWPDFGEKDLKIALDELKTARINKGK